MTNLLRNRLKNVFATVAISTLLFSTSSCHRASATDALDAAAMAIGDDDFVRRCAENEYAAAITLLEEARVAEAEGDHEEARALAEAAQIQAQRAREVAESRREACLDEGSVTHLGEIDPQSTSQTENTNTELDPTYEMIPVYFAFNENTLTDTSQQTLNEHADYFNSHEELHISLVGHCDDRGTVAYNMALGMRRSGSVKTYLERLGVDISRLHTTSYGELQLDDPTNHDRNRRVEFLIRE